MKAQSHAHYGAGTTAAHGIDWKAAVWAGVIAGVVFMMAEMLMVAVFAGQSPWAPPRMIAAMALGEGVLMPPTFDAGIMAVAMAIHFALSIVYGAVLAVLLRNANTVTGVLVGAAFGLAIYLVNFHPVASALFPWFEMARGWISVLAHVLFGVVAGASYVGLRRRW